MTLGNDLIPADQKRTVHEVPKRRVPSRMTTDENPDDSPKLAAEGARVASGLSAHILPASATMIGVCMTVLSIGHLGPGGAFREWVDKLLAVDALIFLLSAMMSFLSLRSKRRSASFESRAESIFIAGLVLLALRAVVLAFSIA